MKSHDRSAKLHSIAGALIFAGVMQWFLIVLLAETLFPGYSNRANDLSDLASTVAPHASPLQPSAWLFNATTFLVGLLVLISAILIHRSGRYGDRDGDDKRLSPAFSALFAISGLFAMGVGVFPGDAGVIHGLTALGWFVTAPLSAIAFSRRAGGAFAYYSAASGVFALIVLISVFALGNSSPFLALGRGGEERLIVFPVLIWMAALSGRLMSD